VARISNPTDSHAGATGSPSSKPFGAYRSGGRAPTGPSEDSLSARFLFGVLRRWWKVVVPVGSVLALAAGVLVYTLSEPTYEAAAWLRIDETAPYLAFESRERPDSYVETQIELIRSPVVLGPATVQAGLVDESAREKQQALIRGLAGRLKVSTLGDSQLVKISLESSDPAKCARIVNAVVGAYFQLRGTTAAEDAEKVIRLLEQERETRAADVARARQQLQQAATSAIGLLVGGSASNSPLSQPLADLQVRLASVRVEQESLKARIAVLGESLSGGRIDVPPAEVEAAVAENAEVAAQEQSLAAKRTRLREIEIRSVQGTSDPFYRQLLSEIARDAQTLELLKSQQRQRSTSELAAAAQARLQGELAALQTALRENLLTERLLRESLADQPAGAGPSAAETLELRRKQTELAQAEGLLDLINQRLAKVRTERRAPDRVALVRAADVPTEPAELVPYKKMALAVLVAFCLPLASAVGWEHWNRRVTGSRQLAEATGLEVIGELPRLSSGATVLPGASSVPADRRLDVFSESVDGLRTYLMLSEPIKHVKVLAVASAGSEEGKTSLASQLAISIAQASGEPTLLIDGDLRRPDIHEVFEVPSDPGLAGVLAGDCTLEDAVVTEWDPHLHLLPAGKLSTSPHKLLGNDAFASLLERIRARYRYVIIDTPPVLAAGESLVLATAADACLLGAMQDRSRLEQFKAACGRLSAAGAHIAGIVLNGVPAKRYSRRYGSYVYAREEALVEAA